MSTHVTRPMAQCQYCGTLKRLKLAEVANYKYGRVVCPCCGHTKHDIKSVRVIDVYSGEEEPAKKPEPEPDYDAAYDYLYGDD